MAKEEKILTIKVDTTEAIKQIAEYRRLIDELKNKSGELNSDERKSIIEYTEAIRVLNKEVKNNLIIEKQKAGSLKVLRAELSNLTKQYDELSRAERTSAKGTQLLDKINNVTRELKEAEMATQRYYRNVGNYSSALGGLGMSVQQVARELPSLTMGLNTFFLAISNNLPILMDNIVLARREFKVLTKAGKMAVPVWRQLISSVFSWQTALVVGVTALTMYGKEIGNWVQSLFKGEKALYDIDEAAKRLNESMASDAGGAIANLEAMSKQWQALGGNLREQEQYIKENASRFKELGIDIKNANDAENALVRNKDAVIESLKQRALATAAMGEATKIYTEYIKKQTEAEKMPEKIKTIVNTGNQYQANWVSGEYDNQDRKKALEDAEELKRKAEEFITKFVGYSEEEDKILDEVGLKKINTFKVKAEKKYRDINEVLKDLNRRIEEDEIKREREYKERLLETRVAGAEEGSWQEHAARLELLKNQQAEELRQYGTTEEMRLAIKKKYDKLMNDENLAYHQERVEREKATKDAEIAIQMERVNAMADVADGLISLMEEVGKSSKAATVAAKILALAQIAIDTGRAISSGIAEASKAGPFPANLVAIATMVSTVLANMAAATKAVKSAKFSTGGDVSGEGTSTSDSIPAMLSDGESVMTAKATSMFAPILSAFNQAGGGVPIYGQQTGNRAMGEDMLAKSFAKGLAEMPAPVVSVEEINRVGNRVKVIENINRI